MQQAQILVWIALGLGAISLAAAVARGNRGPGRPEREFGALLGAAAAVVLLGVLACLPAGSPWSRGQALVSGILLGGLAVLGVAFALRGGSEEGDEAPVTSALPLAVPVVAISVLLLIHPRGSNDAMAGFGMGAAAAGIVIAGGLRALGSGAFSGSTVELATLFSAALAVATDLAIYHRSPAGVREWMPLPALLGAVLAAGVAAVPLLGARKGGRSLLSLGVVLVPTAILAWLMGQKLGGTADFTWAVLAGLGMALVLLLLQDVDPGTEAESGRLHPAAGLDTGLLAGLLVLGASVLAYRELHGFGIAVAAVAGTGVAAVGRPGGGRAASLVRGGLALALCIAFYRSFFEENEYRVRLEQLYEYAALLAGVFLPGLLASLCASNAEGRPVLGGILRPGVAGLAAVAAPLLIWMLIGIGAQAAFLVGIAAGVGFLLSRSFRAGSEPDASFAGLLGIATLLSAVQLTHLLETHLDMLTRTQRVGILVSTAVVLVVLGAVLAWLDRGAKPAMARAER